MEKYKRGKVIEEPLERNRIPIPNLPKDFLWMQVNNGSKVPHLMNHARGVVADGCRHVLWTGCGAALRKAISCAEVMKRECKMPYQINKILFRKCEEFWEPQMDGLERLVVNRDVPVIHILLSFDPLDSSELGYQFAGNKNTFWHEPKSNSNDRRRQRPKVTPDQVAAMGLQSEKIKAKRNLGNL